MKTSFQKKCLAAVLGGLFVACAGMLGGYGSDSASSSGTKSTSFQEDPNDKRTYNAGKYKVGTDLKAGKSSK